DARALPFSSTYVSIQGACVVREGGYYSFPLPGGRYLQVPGETYGRGPAMMVLGSMKTLNAEKKTFLKQGHRAADPVLLTADDGLTDMASLRPGAAISGGMNADGRALIGILPTGEIQISKEMMEEERNIQNDAFLVTLFQILTETPQMTATEVIERTNEKGILLAPTVGRQQSEYIDPMTARELDILSRLGKLPPMPPELREAEGEYTVVSTSPLARAMRAGEAAGFMRVVENVRELAAITQDPNLLDPFDFDVAVPEIAEIQGVPERWMASQQKMQQKRQARAQAMARQQQIQEMPAQAAMIKARAAAMKTQGGMTGGGVLQPASQGTPQFRGRY
ncbi:MAG: portal protein, partial [Alphaproteobacteria bacterium]